MPKKYNVLTDESLVAAILPTNRQIANASRIKLYYRLIWLEYQAVSKIKLLPAYCLRIMTMAFTIYGPGTRDIVTVTKQSPSTIVKQTSAIQETDNETQKNKQSPTKQKQSAIGKQASAAYQQTLTTPNPQRVPAILAEQIMVNPIITLTPNATITQAWKLFRERRFRHIPVLTEKNSIYGIISDRSLLRYAAVTGRTPPYGDDSPEAKTLITDNTATPLVKTKVITATPDTEIRLIARVLFEQHIGVMPIVTHNGHLIGIITRSDILRTLINHAPLELWI